MSYSSAERLRSAVEQQAPSFRSTKILDVRVDVLTRRDFRELLIYYLRNRKRGWFSYINVHTINVAQKLPWFKEFNEQALLSYCDGEGVRFGARLLREYIPERITLSEFIYELAEIAVRENFSLYFLGATQETIRTAVRKMNTLYPQLNICGCRHGFFKNDETDSIVADINSKAPDVLILGMGVPQQELWVKKNFYRLNITIAWMGGGVFDLVGETKRKCSLWVSRIGMEWFYRLIQEPRRLWKRYLIGNPMFLCRIVRARWLVNSNNTDTAAER